MNQRHPNKRLLRSRPEAQGVRLIPNPSSQAERPQLLRCVMAGCFLTVSLVLAPLQAQEPKTEAGARAAAITLVRNRPSTPKIMEVVSDSVALYQELTSCQEVPGSPPTCSLIEGKVVRLVLVHLSSPTSAAVEIRHYQVMRGGCPLGTPPTIPRIGYTRTEHFTLGYAAGHWKPVGGGRGVEC